ncbi:ABC transporter ATP-binding protein [Desulfobacula sp.]|uniref:ABC transporter ATP-binding protein n=1 Tax=Desulfobacula sp. TaxID=2593537 RepID=UPI0025C07919|nr:ATP-binding cassette domain-containing protein [Desulfobacula sp.]MBC2704325.1 ATP-binding cassette domain-containing protein [Desulfobacula sp.]
MTVPLIQFIDIMKSFGTDHVLKGVNLSIYKGEIIAIIGKSGTGKSVLLKHIIGLVQQDSGQILINGVPLHQLSVEEKISFQKELSYMFQDNALFDFMTIYDNIALPLVENSNFPKNQVKEKVFTRMKQLGLTGTEKKFPAQLSGGMRKRVALARALVTDPKIVLFDEPTTGLDPVRKKDVHSMIQEYQEKFEFTAVIVTHDIPQIFDLVQRIAMLDDGIIKFEGSKEDIFDSHSKILDTFVGGEDV